MHEHVIDRCELIEESIKYIELYTKDVFKPNDFRKPKNDFLLIDATMMRLQVIGENIKKINKLEPDFFSENLLFDTNNIIRFRDFISHHYEKLDIDIVFEICKNDLPILKQKSKLSYQAAMKQLFDTKGYSIIKHWLSTKGNQPFKFQEQTWQT